MWTKLEYSFEWHLTRAGRKNHARTLLIQQFYVETFLTGGSHLNHETENNLQDYFLKSPQDGA